MTNISSVTYQVEAPDLGQAERLRVQRDVLIGLLWSHPKTQEAFSVLGRTTKLDGLARRMRKAIHRAAAESTLKRIEGELFAVISASKKTIGRTLSEHVRGLFGRYIPWIAKELILLFVGQTQAYAYGRRMVRNSSVSGTPAEIPPPSIPAGATKREARATLREYKKATLRNLATHRGRVPNSMGNLRRDAAWYYLRVIEGVSPHRLAQDYMRTQRNTMALSEGYNANNLVLQGIRLTASRLDLPSPIPPHTN